MLRINTPGGLFTIREKDVSERKDVRLLWNAIRKDKVTLVHESAPLIVELVACLRGESYYGWYLQPHFLEPLVHPFTRDDVMLDLEQLDEDHVTLVCNDGELSMPKGFLVRTFQLLDDFLTDNPGETSIVIPFGLVEVRNAMRAWRGYALAQCYEVLCHLNPKNNTYYFYFSMLYIGMDAVLRLAARLTVEERRLLLDYGARNKAIIPTREGDSIISLFSSVRLDERLMISLYKDQYPGYLFCYLFDPNRRSLITTSMSTKDFFTWDFSKDQDDSYYDESHVLSCLETLIATMSPIGAPSLSSLESVAAAVDKKVPSILPYGVTLPVLSINEIEYTD